MAKSSFYDSKKAKLRDKVLLASASENPLNDLFFKKINFYAPKNSKILDIGTGNGYVLRELLNKHQANNYRLYGVDSSEEMVFKAVKSLGLNAQILLGDNFNLPFNGNSFETLVAKNVTNFSPSEINRVLIKEGHFVFREYGCGKGLVEVSKLFPERLIRSRDPSYYLDSLTKAGMNIVEFIPQEIKREYDIEELLNVLESYPFIKDYSAIDKAKIKKEFGAGNVQITSDPFILVARAK